MPSANNVPNGATDELSRWFLTVPLDAGLSCYESWLVTTSTLLQDHASYLKNLSECTTPGDVAVCQAELFEKSLEEGAAHIQRSLEGFSEIFAPAKRPAAEPAEAD